MKLIKCVVFAIACGSAAFGTVTLQSEAQEPTKEETIAWLQEKVAQGSQGCTFKVEQHFDQQGISYLQTHRHSLERLATNSAFVLTVEKDIKKTTTQHPSGRSTSETESSSQRYEFSPNLMIEGDVTLIPNTEVLFSSDDRQISSCHALVIGLNSAIGEFDEIVILVNDWDLADRMKSAFEHWGKLERSGR